MTVAGTHRRRHALHLGTALATTLAVCAIPQVAYGQSAADTLPVLSGTQGASFSAGAGTTITAAPTPTPTSLTVNINDQSRVINWQTYNIGAGNTVSYTTANGATQYAVLNRVTGVDSGPNAGTLYRSAIDGMLSSQSNIAVWLSNPAGITFGPGGVFSGGSLVLTTLGIGDTDFLNGGNARLAGTSTADIVIQGASMTLPAASLNSTGGYIYMFAQEISNAGSINASGNAVLIAARDVSFNANQGSPLSFSIAAGTTLSGVEVVGSGSVAGQSVILATTNTTGVMGTLLQVDSGATLTAKADGGTILLFTGFGSNSPIVSNGTLDAGQGSNRNVQISADGSATIGGTATASGNVSVSASGAAALSGAVTAAGNYTVSGSSVTLGGATPVIQSAGGNVDITATAGNITGLSGLALTSDSNGAGGGYVILDAGTTGAIDFARDTAINGGTAGTGEVGLIFDTTKDLSLGDVTAKTLGGVTRGAPPTFDPTATLFTEGTFTAGDITVVSNGVQLISGEDMRLGSVDALAINLTAGGDLTGLALGTSNAANSDPSFGRADLTSQIGAIRVIGDGLVQLGALDAAQDATIIGGNASRPSNGSVDVTSATAGGAVILTAYADAATNPDSAHDGDVLLGTATANGILLVNTDLGGTAGNITVTGDLVVPDGSVRVDAAETATLAGNVSATPGLYSVTGADIVLGNASAAVIQSAADEVSLTATTGGIMLAGDVTLASTGGQAVTLNGAVDGAKALTVNTTGATTLAGAIGSIAPLASLTTDAGGTTAINGGSVTTNGLQTYGDAVTIGALTTLTNTATGAAGRILFRDTVDGAFDLSINAANAGVEFDKAVGDTTPLASLSVVGITELFGGSVETTGAQTYGPLNLYANSTLTGSALTFGSSVLSQGGAFDLSATAATIDFNGPVGQFGGIDKKLANLTANGATTLSGNVVSTTATQTYNGTVTLGATTTLTSSGMGAAGDIMFADTVKGGQALTVTTAGTTMFAGAVGDMMGGALTSLTTNGGGTTDINGGAVTTTGAQTYGDDVVLTADTVLSSTMSGAIAFAGTIDSDAVAARALTVTTAGAKTFGDGVGDAIGSTAALASLTADGGGAIALNGGSVQTTGAQTYTDAVTLGADTTLTSTMSGAIGFVSTLDATTDGGQALTIDTGGAVTLGGATGATARLASLNITSGDTTIANAAIFGSTTIAAGDDVRIGTLVSGGLIDIDAGDDVLLDTAGKVQSTAGSIQVDAGGSVYGYTGATDGSENALPVTDRGFGQVSAGGDVSLSSDGDLRVDSLTAGGSIDLTIAGSLTGTGPGGAGTVVSGGTLLAQGMGGTITVNAGTAGAPSNDIVTLAVVRADGDIAVTADQIAIGTAESANGTLTLNSGEFYVGDVTVAGDFTAALTGQATDTAIPLVTTSQVFDAAYGKTDLTAGGALTGTVGLAAQLGAVGIATAGNLNAAALTADSLTTGSAATNLTATTGTLSVASSTVGAGALILTKQGGSATTAGDELRAAAISGTGPAQLTSSTNIRSDSIAVAGNVSVTASGGDVTGIATSATPGASSATFASSPAPDYAAAALSSSGGTVTATAGGVAQLGAISGAGDVTLGASGLLAGAVTSTGGTVTATAGNGTLALDSASAGTDLTLSKSGGSGAGNDLRVGGSLIAGAGNGLGGGDASLTSNTDIRITDVTAYGGDIAISAANGALTTIGGGRVDLTAAERRDAMGAGVAGTAGAIGVTAGGLVLLDQVAAGSGLTVTTGAATGAGRIDLNDAVVGNGAIQLISTNTTGTATGISAGTLTAGGTMGDVVVAALGATSGDATITSISASRHVDVRSEAGTARAGQVAANGDVALRGADVVSTTIAGQSVGIAADNSISLGTITAAEDIGLMAGSTITATGAMSAGDDFTANASQMRLAGVTAAGTGPDNRHIEFSGQNVSFVAGETSPTLDGSNIVIGAGTGGAAVTTLSAARDAIVNSAGAASLSGAVTAGRDYTVAADGLVTLGSAGAVTQQAGRNLTIYSTTSDIVQGSGRLTLIANSDGTPANNAEQLLIQATGNLLLGNSALIGGSVAGRESDISVSADNGVVTLGKVDGASLLVRAAGDVTVSEAIDAGNAARADDALNSFATIDIASSNGDIALLSATTYGAGHDITLAAAGDVTGLATVATPAAPTLVTTGTVLAADFGAANLTATGSAGVTAGGVGQFGTVLAGEDATISAAALTIDSATATAGGLALTATAGTLRLGTGSGGNDATLIKQGGSATTAGDELRVDTLTSGGRATLTSSTHIRAGSITASNDIDLTASGGDITGLAQGTPASGNPDPNFGRSTLTSTAANVNAVARGLVQLGDVNALLGVGLGAGAPLGGASGAIDVTSATAGGSLVFTAFGYSTADPARDGDIVIGTGSAGGDVRLNNSLGTTGDVVITNQLTVGGAVAPNGYTVSIRSADDVFIAPYVQGATPALDSGFIRTDAGSMEILAQGSITRIGGSENALPTAQRGVAGLGATGNLTLISDGDARFDNLTAGGSLTLDIDGSLTGVAPVGGVSTGTNVAGGALFAQGAGGDIVVRAGLGDTTGAVVDVVTLNRVVADRNITISADQIAVGTLDTQGGTITLADTSGAGITSDNYYVGQLNAAGDVTVVLTGQTTAPIGLVATDAGGSPEFFDSGFGKTDLVAGGSITGAIGQAAQLADVTFGTTLDLDTAALVADNLTSAAGSADIRATAGTLSVLTTGLGGSLTLTKQGGALATIG
ncbi:MAG TPA: filamentous hemagglutinin N-terminal domain-containing protein, partial [Novosphingobium sp.]|nr:filamentous hemagglutinin N-terminal domain-containing protein [Novosphingobium sp.]